jgi:hypothetical protein
MPRQARQVTVACNGQGTGRSVGGAGLMGDVAGAVALGAVAAVALAADAPEHSSHSQ